MAAKVDGYATPHVYMLVSAVYKQVMSGFASSIGTVRYILLSGVYC